MNLKYVYQESEFFIKLKSDSNYTDSQIIGFFKNSLKKKLGLSIYQYLNYLGFSVDKCRLCGVGYPPINIDFHIENNTLNVTGYTYCRKIYCYGDNLSCDGLKLNSNSFEFISRVNSISIDDAKKLLKENNKSPFYKENWKSEVEYKKSQSRSLEFYVKKYGEKDGNKKHIEHKNKISLSNSLEGFKLKYGDDMGAKKYKEVCESKDSMSFKYFLSKNDGDINKSIFEFEKRKKDVNVSIDSLINKYGQEIGIKKHKERVDKSRVTLKSNPIYEEICKSKACSKENFISKYGEEEGIIRYNDKLIRSVVPICKASKESLSVFLPLIKILKEKNNIDRNEIYIGDDTSNEFFLRDGHEIFFYDFTIPNKKLIIEYNGTLFHPKNENSDWINPFSKIDAKTAFNKQKRKIELAKSNGFQVLEIWSDDIEPLSICLDFLVDKI